MCVCVCMLCVGVYMSHERMCVCVFTCVPVPQRHESLVWSTHKQHPPHTRTHTHTHTQILELTLCMHLQEYPVYAPTLGGKHSLVQGAEAAQCVCVCVCVCARARACVYMYAHVCLHAFVWVCMCACGCTVCERTFM